MTPAIRTGSGGTRGAARRAGGQSPSRRRRPRLPASVLLTIYARRSASSRSSQQRRRRRRRRLTPLAKSIRRSRHRRRDGGFPVWGLPASEWDPTGAELGRVAANVDGRRGGSAGGIDVRWLSGACSCQQFIFLIEIRDIVF